MKLEEAIKTMKFSSQKQKAGFNIFYTAWWLKTLVSRELKMLGLTHEQYNVLRILKGKYPEKMCVKDISCRMIERNSNVPRIADRLVAKKFIERAASDINKGETVVTLTNDGMNILEAANLKVIDLFNSSVILKEEDASQLNLLLENMREKE